MRMLAVPSYVVLPRAARSPRIDIRVTYDEVDNRGRTRNEDRRVIGDIFRR
jgi:hypothetical protein